MRDAIGKMVWDTGKGLALLWCPASGEGSVALVDRQ